VTGPATSAAPRPTLRAGLSVSSVVLRDLGAPVAEHVGPSPSASNGRHHKARTSSRVTGPVANAVRRRFLPPAWTAFDVARPSLLGLGLMLLVARETSSGRHHKAQNSAKTLRALAASSRTCPSTPIGGRSRTPSRMKGTPSSTLRSPPSATRGAQRATASSSLRQRTLRSMRLQK
jgi:hypothetical protein